MNIEVALISKLLEDGNYTIIADKQIALRYFSGRNKHAFKFIQKHMVQYGKPPSIETFQRKFPSYTLETGLSEPLEYFCDEVRQKLKHNTIVTALEEVSKNINDLETEDAYKKIKKMVLAVENEIIITDRQLVNKDTQKRLEAYEKRAKSGGITGIPSGIDKLDLILRGYNKGELYTLVAYTGTGKTWLEVIQAVAQARLGYKVLFITTEMSTEAVMRRIDATWNGFSYSRFRDGKLYPEELKKFKKYLEDIEDDEESNLIVEQANAGISQISAKIDQYSPDMVYIDGGYLLSDEEGDEDDWKALVRIWRGVHRISLAKNVPIFMSTQSTERKVSLKTMSFAKAISNDSDVVLALEQDEQQFNDKEARIKPLKIREGELRGSVVLHWDADKPDWSPIYIEGGKKTDDTEDSTPSTSVDKSVQKLGTNSYGSDGTTPQETKKVKFKVKK